MDSRSLILLSTDPDDLSVLTPGPFFIGTSLFALHELSNYNPCISLSSRWKQCNKIRDPFWHRWTKGPQLVGKTKVEKRQSSHSDGSTNPIVKDSAMHPTEWKIALIDKIHPGADGVIQVMKICTNEGTFKRPTQQVAVLPISRRLWTEE